LYECDIIIITETWLHSSIDENLTDLPNYSCFRDDRLNRKGGGVGVWASRHIIPVRLLTRVCNKPVGIEVLWLKTVFGLLCAIYIPPDCITSCATEINNYIISSYDEFSSSDPNLTNVILCGDFNRFNITTICSHLDVCNIINCVTRNASDIPLDLIIVPTVSIASYDVPTSLPPLKDCINNTSSDHNVIYLKSLSNYTNTTEIFKDVFDLRDSNIREYFLELQKINWTQFYRSNEGIDKKCELFYDLMAYALSQIPVDKVKVNDKDKPWISPVCKSIEKKIFLNSHNSIIKDFLENKLHEKICDSKRKWADNEIQKPSGIWNIYKAQCNKNSNTNIMGLIQRDGLEETLRKLDNHFCAAYGCQSTEEVVNYLSFGDTDDDWSIDTTIDEVEDMLINIKLTSAGSDDIHPKLIIAGASILAAPVCHLFHVSVNERRFPKLWKIPYMIPRAKTNHTTKESDFRGIFRPPIFSNLLEQIIIKKHKKKFIDNFGCNQYAYRSLSSTTCCAIRIHDFATSHLDKISSSGFRIISFDMSRAFETIPHHLLMRKLASINLPIGLIRWLASYLLDRYQRVKLFSHLGNWKATTSSVPQGSCLGPILFSIFIKDLSAVHDDSLIVKFADDINLSAGYNRDSIIEDHSKIKDEINNINNWTSEHGLCLNEMKTKQITYVKGTNSLPNTGFTDEDHIRILGFIFTPNLNWTVHIENVVKNASRRLYALKHLKDCLDIPNLIKVYFACIRSILEYGSPLYIGAANKDLDTLDYIQRRAERTMGCDKLPNLNFRRIAAANKLLILAETRPDHILHDLIPHRNLRTNEFNGIFCNTTRRSKSFVPYMTTNKNLK
jgi:hypothetical protein